VLKIKDLLENAASCRQEAGDFILGQHSELAGPLMWGAVMDSLLALALIARESERGARRRHVALASQVEALLGSLPRPAGRALDPEDLAWPGGELEPLPEPVGESSARLLWLADRLIDGAWHQGILSEVSEILRRLALAPTAPTGTAPSAQAGGEGLPSEPAEPSPIEPKGT
jgi:hypothetical protein